VSPFGSTALFDDHTQQAIYDTNTSDRKF